MVVLKFDIPAPNRRSEGGLLFKHLREVHVHLGVVFDHGVKLFDHRMKRSFLLLGSLNNLRQPIVEMFRLRRQPASQASRIASGMIHNMLSQNGTATWAVSLTATYCANLSGVQRFPRPSF